MASIFEIGFGFSILNVILSFSSNALDFFLAFHGKCTWNINNVKNKFRWNVQLLFDLRSDQPTMEEFYTYRLMKRNEKGRKQIEQKEELKERNNDRTEVPNILVISL